MSTARSFTEYVKTCLDSQLWNALVGFLETVDISSLDLHPKKVRNIGEIELYDTSVQFVDVSDLPESRIAFNVVVDATLIIYDADRYHNDESESTHQWFMMHCEGNLDTALKDLAITGIDIYSNRKRAHRPMSDSLVPIISKNELEQEADGFLKKYYPEARETPMWVDPAELARRMHLTILNHAISEDGSIFGQIYFQDSDAKLYDEKTEQPIIRKIKAGTIIVDPNVVFLRNLGAHNNTIVHECVHGEYHKKAFALERLFNANATLIGCKVSGGIAGSDNNRTRWMEWQANTLTPRIQMPLIPFKRKTFELIQRYRKETGLFELCDLMQPIIESLAEFFAVSRMAAKIRLLDIGYEEAAGAFTYIDGHYIQPYAYKKGVLKANQTYSIPARDAAILSVANMTLRENIRDGSYIYVDSHYVLNHPKYLYRDENDTVRMTDYARYHVDECCIAFNISLKTLVEEHYHTECYLNRDQYTPFDFNITFDDNLNTEQKNKLLGDTIKADIAFLRTLPNDFAPALGKCLQWRGMSNAELSRETGIAEKTIGNIINGKQRPKLASVVLLCLGLHLPPQVSEFLIEKSSYRILFSDPDCVWYDFALHHMYTKSIPEIREALQAQGCTVI